MYQRLIGIVFLFVVVTTQGLAQTWPNANAVTGITTEAELERYSVWDEVSQTRELKYIIVLNEPEGDPEAMLILDSHKYPMHIDFFNDADNQQGFAMYGRDEPEYMRDALTIGQRWYLSGSLFWKPGVGDYHEMYVRRYESIDQVLNDIEIHQDILKSTIPGLPDKIPFHPRRRTATDFSDEWAQFPFPVVADDQLESRNHIGYVEKTAYGMLTSYEQSELERGIEQGKDFSREILVLGFLPYELPIAAGVITTVPQSALSHVSVKARQRGIPSAYVRTGTLDFAPYLNQAVKLEVAREAVAISAITDLTLIDQYVESLKPKQAAPLPVIDMTRRPPALLPLVSSIELRRDGWHEQIGAKAYNYAQLVSYVKYLRQPDDATVTLKVRPGFAISQFYFRQFLMQNGLDTTIAQALAQIERDPRQEGGAAFGHQAVDRKHRNHRR